MDPKAHLPTDELVLIENLDQLTPDMLAELSDGVGEGDDDDE